MCHSITLFYVRYIVYRHNQTLYCILRYFVFKEAADFCYNTIKTPNHKHIKYNDNIILVFSFLQIAESSATSHVKQSVIGNQILVVCLQFNNICK